MRTHAILLATGKQKFLLLQAKIPAIAGKNTRNFSQSAITPLSSHANCR